MAEDELPPFFQPSQGNLTALLLVDSRRPEHALVEPSLLAALGHLGLPYAPRDLAAGPLAASEVEPHPLVIVGQEGLGASLGDRGVRAMLQALAGGAGLVSFDPDLSAYGAEFGRALRVAPGEEQPASQVFRITADDHWVTGSRQVGEEVETLQGVRVRSIRTDCAVLLGTRDGRAALVVGHHGRGRYALWTAAPELWLQSHLGHAQGLDDLFWKSLVWCARKPFVMKAMPPFVTARIDDVCGLNSLWWVVATFGVRVKPLPRPVVELVCDVIPGRRSTARGLRYLDLLNEHGYIPNLGLYPDQMGEAEWAKLKEKRDAGLAEPFAHAFSDHISAVGYGRVATADEVRIVDFAYHASPSARGKRGEPWSPPDPPDVAREKFARLDAVWQARGIRPARTVNSHWHNPSPSALPFLKERGQTSMMSASLFGISLMEPEAYAWRMAPYGVIGSSQFGGNGCFTDYPPIPDGVPGVQTGDFFAAGAYWTARVARGQPIHDTTDFLVTEVASDSRPAHNLEAAAKRLAMRLRIGLDSMFFGLLMTHEQHLALLTEPELEDLLTEVDRLTARYEKQFAGYDHVAGYAKAKFDSHLAAAELRRDGRVSLRLTGRTSVPLQLYVFSDEGERCVHRYEQIPPFDGATEISFTGDAGRRAP